MLLSASGTIVELRIFSFKQVLCIVGTYTTAAKTEGSYFPKFGCLSLQF